jgi:type II secretory pathway pseudopilin PulG
MSARVERYPLNRPGDRAADRPRSRTSGSTLLELLIGLLVLGVLGTILLPFLRCSWEKGRVASRLSDLRSARDAVEAYIQQHGGAPTSLQQAFDAQGEGTPRPPRLFYCATTQTDPDAGDGNSCDRFDQDNPSGQAEAQLSLPGGYYILTTDRPIAPACQRIDIAWVTCCDRSPQIIRVGESP